MSTVFDYSQGLRTEIEKSSLLKDVENRLTNINLHEAFAAGTQNNHFRIGRLESGIYVAMRQVKDIEYVKIIDQFQRYETYSQNAERCNERNLRATRFCIGVKKGDISALLIEDLTENRKRGIRAHPHEMYGWFEDTEEIVYLDLDFNYEKRKTIPLKFMNEPAIITF